MKDKKWLIKEIDNLIYEDSILKQEPFGHVLGWINAEIVKKIISQLEEPEVTEEQVMNWLDNNEFYDHRTAETILANAVDKGRLSYYDTKYSVVQKPVIPLFVAKYLELAKTEITLMRVMELASRRNEISRWTKVYDWIAKNHELFARAWIVGYEGEKEPHPVLKAFDEKAKEYSNYESTRQRLAGIRKVIAEALEEVEE